MPLTDILNERILVWISENKMTFLLVILLLGNAYQYIDRRNLETENNTEKAKLNDRIQQIGKESVDYERQRSEKLEFLLRNLSQYQDANGSKDKTHSNR